MSAPDISIVVCTQNRAGLLRTALTSLADLASDELFNYEIVVIDNGSTDATPQTIAAAAAKSKHLIRGVHEPRKGIVPARNRGVREASGRWIAFFDDDQLADPDWLVELYRGATEKKCRVVGGAVHLNLAEPNAAARTLHPAVRMLLGEAKHANDPMPYCGRVTPGCGNLMIERTVFEQIGLFERTVSGRGEDTDLFSRIQRAGIAAWYFPAAIVHHWTPSERLHDDHLLGLARRVGEGVAVRQAEQCGTPRFAVLWLGKAIRLAVVQWPLLHWARLRGDREMSLGRRCLLAINASFVASGWRLLWQPHSHRQAASANASQNSNDFQTERSAGASLMHPTK